MFHALPSTLQEFGPPGTFSGRRGAVARTLRDKTSLEMGNRPEGVEHPFAGGRGRVEAGDAETIAGACMIDQLRQPRALELPSGDHVDEDTDGVGLA